MTGVQTCALPISEDFPPPDIKTAVRDMLRLGGFKPAGRQKPSSEYLGQAAREGRFPSINGPVDCNNVLSLDLGLPISLLDADATGPDVMVRIAAAGASYVFNASGQDMDLEGLLCIYGNPAGTSSHPTDQGGAVPLGNPVKDSMQGKIKENSRRLAGFIYAPPALYTPETLALAGERFAAMLRDYCGADAAVAAVV